MAQHVQGHVLDVLRGDETATSQKRRCLRPQGEEDRRARRRAVLDQVSQIQPVRLRLARGLHQVHDVILDAIVDVYLVYQLARRRDVLGLHHRFNELERRGLAHAIEDDPLLGFGRIGHLQLEHEAIDLRLGQRIGSLLLDGVLRWPTR
jgi:hypothetical protein